MSRPVKRLRPPPEAACRLRPSGVDNTLHSLVRQPLQSDQAEAVGAGLRKTYQAFGPPAAERLVRTAAHDRRVQHVTAMAWIDKGVFLGMVKPVCLPHAVAIRRQSVQ